MKKLVVLVFVLALMVTPAFAGDNKNTNIKVKTGDISTDLNSHNTSFDSHNVNTDFNSHNTDIRTGDISTDIGSHNTKTTTTVTKTDIDTSVDSSVGSHNTEVKVDKPYLNVPVMIGNELPSLSFGEVKMVNPIITDARLKAYNGEIVISVVHQGKAKMSNIFGDTVDIVNAANQKEDLNKCRVVFIAHPSTKMFSIGGNTTFGAAGTGGTTGLAGGLGIFPTYGRMTADTIIDIIIVRVVN